MEYLNEMSKKEEEEYDQVLEELAAEQA